MKFRITATDPDGIYDSAMATVEARAEKPLSRKAQHDRATELLDKIESWVPGGDRITIEVDTVAKTARVIKTGKL